MQMKIKPSIFFFLFLIENLLFLNFLVLKRQGEVLSSVDYSDGCPLSCQELMDEKISKAISGLSTVSSKKPLSVNYIPLGDGGLTNSTLWNVVDGSEFTFDLSDYPADTKVYWEGNLKAGSFGSRCYARLYDTTHYRQVDYSLQSTSDMDFETLMSQPLSIWRGENHYRLEIRSLDSVICSLETPRLVVKY